MQGDPIACYKLVETINDQIRYLRRAVERSVELTRLRRNDVSGSATGVEGGLEEQQEQIVRLKAMLSTKREQIATLRSVLKANKQTAETALSTLKAKYETEKVTRRYGSRFCRMTPDIINKNK